MSTMIERVARAIDDCPEWPAKTYRKRLARAAVEAMREPTDAMRNAVASNWGSRTWREYGEVIDAALKEDALV